VGCDIPLPSRVERGFLLILSNHIEHDLA